jgi:AraC-like DNA-binding protein
LFQNCVKFDTIQSQADITFGVVLTERHLTLQELSLQPSMEWIPRCNGWLVARMAEGVGYWLSHHAPTVELTVGDGFITFDNADGVVRVSQLGPLKLQFFTVVPQHLVGLLTAGEMRVLQTGPARVLSTTAFFKSTELLGQKFTRLANLGNGGTLPMRCAWLQLWASAIAFPAETVPAPGKSKNLRERFRQLVNQMSAAELASTSLADQAGRLGCSKRQFQRIFREEFGVPFRMLQIEFRLQRAHQLIADSNVKIASVALDSGYQHLGLFNVMFKKRFGMLPSEWRRQNLSRKDSSPAQNGFHE